MTTAAEITPTRPGSILPLGRMFVNPTFDLMVIGGGLSLLLIPVFYATGFRTQWTVPQNTVLWVILLANSSHFAASTVRLYTKPGAFHDLPVMTRVFPLLSVVVVTLGLVFSNVLGDHLYALYQSWSPYHYAAQTYGLAAMYAGRSGCKLVEGDRRLLWWTCMLPFLYSFMGGGAHGLGWFVPPSVYIEFPQLLAIRADLVSVIGILVFAVPALLLVRVYRSSGSGLPLISALLILTNGMWWVTLTYMGAFVWATIFHGVQYLAIVIIFHLRDHPPQRSGPTAWVRPALKFYGLSLAGGYALFEIWPYAYTMMGFTFSESVLLTVSVINIHHFIVDRGIWRMRGDETNRKAASA